MPNTGLDEKDRIQIILAEYNSLRAESTARMTSVYQVATMTALVLIWLLQQKDGGAPLYLGLIAAIAGLSICAWTIARDLGRTGIRVRQIEGEINKRAGEDLMVWESKWGGQTSSLWGSQTMHRILRLNRPPYSD